MKKIIFILFLAFFSKIQCMDIDPKSEKLDFSSTSRWICNDENFKEACQKGIAALNNSNLKRLIKSMQRILSDSKYVNFGSEEEKQIYIRSKIEDVLNLDELNESKELLSHPLHNNNLIQIIYRANLMCLSTTEIESLYECLIKIFGSQELFYDIQKFTQALFDFKKTEIYFYLRKGIPINAVISPCGATALIMAVCKGYESIIEDLLSIPGIDVNAQEFDDHFYDYTALHHAITNEDYFILDVLLKNKSFDIDIQNDRGETAVMIASRLGLKKILKMILEKFSDADLSLTDYSGKRAIDIAASIEIKNILEHHEKFY